MHLSCQNTKSVNYFLEFLCRKAFTRSKRPLLLCARRESLGNMLRNASHASSGDALEVSGISSFPGFWAVWLGSALREIARQAKYTSNPPGIKTAAAKTKACTRGFVIASHPIPYDSGTTPGVARTSLPMPWIPFPL